MAYRRTAARAQSGLAAAYAAKRSGRAGELLSRAIQSAHESELPEHNAAAASLPELYWSMAVGCARLGDVAEALGMHAERGAG